MVEPQSIAVVNDDEGMLGLMRTLLADEGYPGTFWATGEDAYEMIRDRRPAVVVLDIRMERPDSGLKVLEMVRLDRRTAAIPVIVCSADHAFLREREAHLRSLGCDTLAKPFTLDALLERIAARIGPPAAHQ
jgi:CheY-like chemotaxis protein